MRIRRRWTWRRPALVGTDQDLLGGYEAGSLLIAGSERVADCGPSLIAPNADSTRWIGDSGPCCERAQIVRFCAGDAGGPHHTGGAPKVVCVANHARGGHEQ